MIPTSPHRTTRRRNLEETASELVSTVLSDDWQSGPAASRVLRRAHGDRHVLMLLRARVARRLAGRPTPIDQRVAATLDAALGATWDGARGAADLGPPGVPRQFGACDG